MKNIFIIFIATISLVACTSSDDGAGNNTNFSYLPLAINNSWDYDVATGQNVLNDNLEVTAVSGNDYTLTATPVAPAGLMTGVLSSGELTASNGKLTGNGTIGFNFQGVGDFSIDIVNGILYDQNANNGSELFSTSGVFTQTVDTYDLDINYKVTTKQLSNKPSIAVVAGTFTDVLHSQLIIEVSITTDISIGPITQTLTLLDTQDVIVVDNYWAQDVGLIKSDNQLDYELEDFSGLPVNLPVPQSASVLTTQDLTSYTVN